MKKMGMAIVTSAVLLSAAACGQANSANRTPETPAKVYFIREINAQNLVKIYEALGREAKGKVAVKLSTGEPGGNNFLQPAISASSTDFSMMAGSAAAAGMPNRAEFTSGEAMAVSRPTRQPYL